MQVDFFREFWHVLKYCSFFYSLVIHDYKHTQLLRNSKNTINPKYHWHFSQVFHIVFMLISRSLGCLRPIISKLLLILYPRDPVLPRFIFQYFCYCQIPLNVNRRRERDNARFWFYFLRFYFFVIILSHSCSSLVSNSQYNSILNK